MTVTDVMPAVEVAAPAVQPAPFGLFSLGMQTPPADGRWQAGAWWKVLGCNAVGVTYGVCTVDSVVPNLANNVNCDIAVAGAFTVYAKSGESMGGMPVEQRRAMARDALIGGEQHAVEQMLWELLLAATPVVADTAASHREGVARAEGLIRDAYGGTPVMHMSPFTATMVGWDALRVEGARLVSFLGSSVVAGSGYDDASPGTGVVSSIIASGGLVVMRGEIARVGDVFNQATNQIDELVERTYVVGWDCTAVRVTIPNP